MKTQAACLVLCLCSVLAQAGEQNVPPAGFTNLFNGEDLSGWHGQNHFSPYKLAEMTDEERSAKLEKDNANMKEHWQVEDGEIVNDGKGVYLTTDKKYGDFELLVDWKMVGEHTDSGIYLRGCPQVQIWDPSNPKQFKHGNQLGSGGLWNNNKDTAGKDPLVKADNPVGEWNTFRIKMIGDRVTVHLNDKLVVDNAEMHNYWNRDIPMPEQGPIQLQTHGGEMRFRNVFVREIE
ncbi:3-keto-disaccharide hydrolase [Calycomorphotria hydatis]|uniref:3-keto-alpha-glucoside-1,2-lyase/3-keto-2-hydroxy-glucal hydratase domain-containing protein n=1 Tax=Calycomorphotria hydatis TaxID=2528027 RepID=A0A517T6W2_9PLAN|nr:DUF1080 domain-containing protein [Calycomorphotria hydatis]QDT64108.1 hypothetical protein V22_13390 [Calycomorphotria hydatis]